jgi:hypothetical protein
VTEDVELERALYDRVSESYHKVDDFRMKLLGFLPVATGTAVFLLLNQKAQPAGGAAPRSQNPPPLAVDDALLAIGLFGFAFTLGLFAYELYGIKKCHYLIVAGARLEHDMKVRGQFLSRPRELARFINEPFASAVIYPASLAAWLYLAFALKLEGWAIAPALAVFLGGLIGTPLAVKRVKINQEREDLVMTVVGKQGRSEQAAAQDAAQQWNTHCHANTSPGPRADGVDGAHAVGPRPRWFDKTVTRLVEQSAIRRGADGRLHPHDGIPWTGPPDEPDAQIPGARRPQ